MVTNFFALAILTAVGGLIYFALERKTVRRVARLLKRMCTPP